MNLNENKQFQNNLLQWYDNHARILPWREDTNPYKVWISEVMLQQTRVEAVRPYFLRFIEQCPTVFDLAMIDIDTLMKLWQGLGYYSRARNLKKTAQIVCSNYQGDFPKTIEGLQSLPGIGPYTASAIASICFEVKIPAMDGNVYRVMSRIAAIYEEITAPSTKKLLEKMTAELLPDQKIGLFNQAMMELGATVCLPNGKPKCSSCPVKMFCKSFDLELTKQIPYRAKKNERKVEQKTIFLIVTQDKIAIKKRPATGLLADLWSFPMEDGYIVSEDYLNQWNPSKIQAVIPLQKTHSLFTHIEWDIIGYGIICKEPLEGNWIWVTLKELKNYSIPSALKIYYEIAEKFLKN